MNNFARAHNQYLEPPDDDPICEDGCGEALVQDTNEDWFCNNKFCPLKFNEGSTEREMAELLIGALGRSQESGAADEQYQERQRQRLWNEKGLIMKKIYVELTDEQKQKLFGMQDEIMASNVFGNPSMALGQIHFTGRDAVLVCAVVPHDQAVQVIEIVAPENSGKVAGDKHATEALRLARV